MTANNQPLTLDAMLQNGATLCNAPVVRVLVQWADGRKMEVDLPRNFTAPLSEEQSREAKIIAFMAKVADGLNYCGESFTELPANYWNTQAGDFIRRKIYGTAFDKTGEPSSVTIS